ncbi:MAG: hypothetical protein N3E45_17125 [Oscillatoriaceae bacterium SKW80]|nr:hypothetical protein [Oscillatoriaceae bacterium SKW80]HIK27958.1 hypothetical protein [Oscillatoriaceae cyanobacterium M7585_C2015_266]
MATQSLARVYFAIKRNTENDSQQSNPDPLGYFSCRLSTARFLDIEGDTTLPVVIRERRGFQKSRTLADGTTIVGREEGTVIISGTASKIVLPVSTKGSRTVILTTGKGISDSKRRFGKENAFHTISFRFPSFATVAIISEALGEIIPTNKINGTPNPNQIKPYFKVVGGRNYPIMQKAAAESRTAANVPNGASFAALAGDGIEVIPGAG